MPDSDATQDKDTQDTPAPATVAEPDVATETAEPKPAAKKTPRKTATRSRRPRKSATPGDEST